MSMFRSPGALPAALATALATSTPETAAAATWNAAKALFDACLAAENAYDMAVWSPAYHSDETEDGPDTWEDIDNELTRLVEQRCDADGTFRDRCPPSIGGGGV